MPSELVMMESEEKMDGAVAHLIAEFNTMRTGRASVHLLDNVKVNYYGAETPLNQLATVHAPEPTLLTVAPFDASVLGEVEKAIVAANLGINPMNDGKLIRLPVPPLTEERRAEMAKQCAHNGEDAKTAVRNVRRNANDQIKVLEKDKELSEDQMHDALTEIQELTDNYIKKIDAMIDKKQQELMQV